MNLLFPPAWIISAGGAVGVEQYPAIYRFFGHLPFFLCFIPYSLIYTFSLHIPLYLARLMSGQHFSPRKTCVL
jgi:hypothetical protein